MDSQKQMNDYWHIPRASLASSASSAVSSASSSNRSNKSHSNPPTVGKRAAATSVVTTHVNNFKSNYGRDQQQQQKQQQQRRSNHLAAAAAAATSSAEVGVRQTRSKSVNPTNTTTARRNSALSATSASATAAAAAAVLAAAAAAKRGSRSSQGSSDSNNSTRSAASDSLLLTAANLERFTEIHKKQQKHNKLYQHEGMASVHNATATTINTTAAATYNANLVHALAAAATTTTTTTTKADSSNNDAIITIDPNLDFIKTKDLDTVSIASSMHFTMVNGEGGAAAKKPKRGLCDRGRQVTVLIVSMSTIFLLLIMGMVYALEMRAREMPQS